MKAVVLAVLAGLCWGVGEIFTKMALNTGKVGPFTIVFVRAVVVLPLSIVVYWFAVHAWKTEPAAWARQAGLPVWAMLVLGSGLMAGFLGVFFFYWGLGSPGGDISKLRPIAFALAPATAVLLGWLMLGESMTVKKALAIVLIVAGIAMLATEGGHAEPGRPTIEPAAK